MAMPTTDPQTCECGWWAWDAKLRDWYKSPGCTHYYAHWMAGDPVDECGGCGQDLTRGPGETG